MGSVTSYAVLPFVRDEEGELCPVEPVECQSAGAATTRARFLAAGKAGAVAFSRTGAPNDGEWADPVILARVGETPSDLAVVGFGHGSARGLLHTRPERRA